MTPGQWCILLALPLALAACAQPTVQDRSAQYQAWLAKADNHAQANALAAYLDQQGVGDVYPMDQLLRSDTNWRRCKAEPFAVPSRRHWPNMVPTLKLIRAEIVPLIGPVEAQSVYRDAAINGCIKGASQSYHLRFHAIDMKPAPGVTRAQLITKLCQLHREKGARLNMGLGIYTGTRFHIDAAGYRGWGHDFRGASFPCRDIRSKKAAIQID
jgi:uncharacterized protein YcbK (DUF882 family)